MIPAAKALAALLLAAPLAGSSEPGGPSGVVGPPRGAPLSGAALEARTKEVAGLLRCPVCQGLSVADSPASMALKMKDEVREMLAAGYDQEQILAYFETSYGEFVRLKPPLRGVNWLVWLAPLVALGLGGSVVAWALRSPPRGAPATTASPTGEAAAVPGPDTLPEDPELASYVRRVREIAYGWPGGVPPTSGGS